MGGMTVSVPEIRWISKWANSDFELERLARVRWLEYLIDTYVVETFFGAEVCLREKVGSEETD